ncbi:MAG: exo-alpha-sialidase [Candidatus Omnitrophica bacterium]|nr:exo-alpha-sialidase [Candidatus Omnitrophota bacterium]
MRSTRKAGIWVMFWVLWLLPELAISAPTADEPSPEVITVMMKAVEGGESEVKADDCRRIVVGPGINEVDPFPGWGGFVGWESPIRLKSGEWLVGFNAGYWHASPPTPLRFPEEVLEEWHNLGMPEVDAPRGGRAMIVRSTDEGKSWSKPETLIDTPADDRHPSFLELPDGAILCSFFTYVGKGDYAKDPSLAHRTQITRSFDGGRTWEQTPKPLPSPFVADESDGPMLLLDDGSVLIIINGAPPEGGPDQAAVLRTSDRGDSWELLSTLSTDHELLEPTIAQLPDGRLVMMARPEGDIAWSEDGGKTWTDPVTFGLRLFAPSLYVLKDGTLLCLHGSYAGGGLRATFSSDGGRTWIGPATDRGFLIDNSYGYGKAMELPDGSLFITYLSTGGHRTEDAQQNAIRCIRMRVRADHSGIDLLPAPNQEEPE